MSMLLVVTHRLWSIIGDSGAVVSSVRPSALVPFSLHVLTGNLGSRPHPSVPGGVLCSWHTYWFASDRSHTGVAATYGRLPDDWRESLWSPPAVPCRDALDKGLDTW